MIHKPLVFVCRKIPNIALEMLGEVAEVKLHLGPLPPTRQELLQQVRGCHGILSLLSDRIDAEVMDAAGSGLRVISNFAVGYNNIDIAQASLRGIAVGNTPDVLTDATADIAVALILAASRQFKPAMQAASDGGWRTWEPLGWLGQGLNQKTLGIVGMGRIGMAVAKRLHGGWGMKVIYTARTAKPETTKVLEAQFSNLDQLLAESDFVSIHVPLNENTRHLISDSQLERMKSSAVLVNTSRGEVVDQEALVRALQQNRIFAAGLDVCTPEPLPVEHPLHRLPNCLLLPHIGSATIEARNMMAKRSALNLMAGLQGNPLPHAVATTVRTDS